MPAKSIFRGKNQFFILLAVLVIAVLVIGAAGCIQTTPATEAPATTEAVVEPDPGQEEAEPTQSPDEPEENMIEPPPFECSEGDEQEPIECTAESLEDESGERVPVKVILPLQEGGVTVVAVAVPFAAGEGQNALEILREITESDAELITNFVVGEQGSFDDIESIEEIIQFNPPITIQVGLSSSQLEASEKELFLGYWDFNDPDGDPQWILFRPNARKELQIVENEFGPALEINISEWGDALIGGGP